MMEPLEVNEEPASSNHAAKIEDDKAKRFEYLLKQTETFGNFLQNIKKKDPSTAAVKKTKGKKQRNRIEDEQIDESVECIAFEETPNYIKGGQMRDYQIRGLNWMISLYENKLNGILADEMGLGKTLQTISILGYLKHYHGILGPHLVIVPKSTLQNWMNEFKQWCPSLKAICFWGLKDDRTNLKHNVLLPGKWNVCITSYDVCLSEKTALKKFNWRYMVIDEAHRIKNEETKLAHIVREFNPTNRLLLTGTPLQNSLHELWSLLNFLLPDIFNSSVDFDAWFDTNQCLGDMDRVQRLHGVLKPFFLRRIKSEVEKSLLPKKEIKVFCRLTKMQTEWYKKILLKDIDVLAGDGTSSKMRIQNILMHLRKCCNHPYMFDGAEPGPPYTTDYHLIENSGKMRVLDKLLGYLKEKGSRVLLFTQMLRMLDILEDYCFYRGYKYCRLDGSTAHEDRARMIDEYNAPNSEHFIFMISTRAGGLGINLASADAVIIYESDWNPQVDLQAIDRAHRIGQTKQVHVYRLVVENTVDVKIQERAAIKLNLDRMVIQQGGLTERAVALNKDEVRKIVLFGAQQIIDSKYFEKDDEDIETILQRGEELALKEAKALEGLTLQPQSVYDFEGEDWKEKQLQQKAEQTKWLNLPKRQRKVVDDVYGRPIVEKTLLAIPDYQFYPKRLAELLEKEEKYKAKIDGHTYRDPDLQLKVDIAIPLNDSEEMEKATLLPQAFTNWSKGDFFEFVNALVKYGRDNIEAIANNISGKTPEEVVNYNCVFWARFDELHNNKWITNEIERAEREARNLDVLKCVLHDKVSNCEFPYTQVQVPHYEGNDNFEELDRFIICKAHDIGNGIDKDSMYKKIYSDIQEAPQFQDNNSITSLSYSKAKMHFLRLFAALKKDYNSKNRLALAQKRKIDELSEATHVTPKKVKSDGKPLSKQDPKTPTSLDKNHGISVPFEQQKVAENRPASSRKRKIDESSEATNANMKKVKAIRKPLSALNAKKPKSSDRGIPAQFAENNNNVEP